MQKALGRYLTILSVESHRQIFCDSCRKICKRATPRVRIFTDISSVFSPRPSLFANVYPIYLPFLSERRARATTPIALVPITSPMSTNIAPYSIGAAASGSVAEVASTYM